jgi:hypothetical protein
VVLGRIAILPGVVGPRHGARLRPGDQLHQAARQVLAVAGGQRDNRHGDPDAILIGRKAGEKPVEYLKYELKNVMVSSYSVAGSSSSLPYGRRSRSPSPA